MNYDAAISVTGSLRDNSTYATLEPDGSLALWTAKNSAGDVVKLRVSGGSAYFNSRTTEFSFGALYWGTDVSFEFDLGVSDAGDTITLTSTSVIAGETVTQTASVDVYEQTIHVVYEYELIGAIGVGHYSGVLDASIDGVSYRDYTGGGQWAWPTFGGWYNLSSTPSDEITQSANAGSVNGGTLTLDILSLRDGATYLIDGFVQFSDCTAKLTMTLTVAGTEYVYTDITDTWRGGPEVEIDADTLVVTQISP